MSDKKTLETMTYHLRSRMAPATFIANLSHHRHISPRLVGGGLTLATLAGAAALTIVLLPRPAMAWGEIQEATRSATWRHVRKYEGDHVFSETWSGPAGEATQNYVPAVLGKANTRTDWAPTGTLSEEIRSDRQRRYSFIDKSCYWAKEKLSPNARKEGTVETLRGSQRTQFQARTRLEEILDSGSARPMEEPPTKEDHWFEVGVPFFQTAIPAVQMDSKGKVSRITLPAKRYEVKHYVRVNDDQQIVEVRPSNLPTQRYLYEYPENIPASTFIPKPQSKTVPVLDMDAVRARMVTQMRKGSGERNGVNLRLALLDRDGVLYLFWTGVGSNAGVGGDVRLPGVHASEPLDVWDDENARAFLRTKIPKKSWREVESKRPVQEPGPTPELGQTLSGRSLVPREKIESQITVVIPGRGGEAVFRNVPVMRIGELRQVRDVLGYK